MNNILACAMLISIALVEAAHLMVPVPISVIAAQEDFASLNIRAIDSCSFFSTDGLEICAGQEGDIDAYIEGVIEKCEESVFWQQYGLCEAPREIKPRLSDPLIAFLMKSHDQRSVALLKKYLPETGVIEILDTLPYVADTKDFGAWAKNLSPGLVIEKAEIAYPAPREFSRCLSELIKGTSEGELAFKEYIKEHERPGFVPGVHLNPFCRKKTKSCTIL